MAVVEAVYFGGKEPCNNRAPASGEDYDPSGVHALADGALPRALPWRPVLLDDTGARLNPRPTAPGYQSAIVVASDGGHDVLSSDPLGRIKVKFHWQKGGASVAGTSCWLRVAQRYAGPGVGSQFLPRVGQEVLVAFLEGDIDRPLVVGALYDGQGEAGVVPVTGGRSDHTSTPEHYVLAIDHHPTAQANLPSTGNLRLHAGHATGWLIEAIEGAPTEQCMADRYRLSSLPPQKGP